MALIYPLPCHSPKDDYETFKGSMEDKADRQDALASSMEASQARLEDVERNIAALTEDMETAAQEMQVKSG